MRRLALIKTQTIKEIRYSQDYMSGQITGRSVKKQDKDTKEELEIPQFMKKWMASKQERR